MKKGKEKKKIFVNVITLLRAIAALAVFPIFSSFGGFAVAIFLAFMMATDFMDGYLARKWGVCTFFGSILDAVSDKIITILAALSLLGIFPSYLLIMVFMEVAIFALENYFAFQGNKMGSSKIGKFKTWVLAIVLVGGFALADLPKIFTSLKASKNVIMAALTLLAFTFQFATLRDYLKKGSKELLKKEKEEKNIIKEEILLEKPKINKIALQKEILKIQKEKLLLEKEKRKWRSLSEIKRDLWDEEFFMQNKDKSVRELIYTRKN